MRNLSNPLSAIRGMFNRKRVQSDIREFIQHNESVFPKHRTEEGGPVFLMEIHSMASAIIGYSYLASIVSEKYNATVVGYVPTVKMSRGYQTQDKHTLSTLDIYQSFCADTIVFPQISYEMDLEARQICSELERNIKTKRQFEELCVHEVEIGALIYDSYLRENGKPTIDIGSQKLSECLLTAVREFLFWQKYFKENQVCGINVSHCVYTHALPLRIAIHLDVPAYQINATHAYRLNSKDTHAYNDFKYFPTIFRSIDSTQREAGLELARSRLERRFSGEVGVDLRYSTKSGFSSSRSERLLSKNPGKKKILVATHCFSDSPHAYGKNIFPDFYEWMECLGQLSNETDYDWHVKTHADFLPKSREVTQLFVDKYPKFNMLPADCSHTQLVAEGIDVCLTVFGTIAYEYAAMGIPTITASENCPTIAYDFNYHPRTVQEYRNTLLSLDKFELQIDRRKVYEWYFMAHIYHTENWLFGDYDSAMKALGGGYYEQFEPRMYRHWVKNCWNIVHHRQIINSLNCFVESGDLRLDARHV